MFRALVGFFDHLHEAEVAARDLQTGDVRVTRLHVWSEYAMDDPQATGLHPTTTGDRWSADTTYIRQRLEDMGVDLVHADGYAEGVRRGCTLLTAVIEDADFEAGCGDFVFGGKRIF